MARTAKEFSVTMEDRPGSLARLTEALSKGGVNIEAIAAVAAGGKGDIRIVMENAAGARQSLQVAGIPVGGERDVLVVDLEHRPGELAKVARKLADAGVNVDAVYVWGDVAGKKRLVLGVGDLDKAQKTLG
jgi:hypothetical protein